MDYNLHAVLEFGDYVQTHEEHSNAMTPRTVGGLCLGPTGSPNGSHYFLNLSTGKRIIRTRWTQLPLPNEVIDRVQRLARQQRTQRDLAFGYRDATVIPDTIHDHYPDDDATDDEYHPPPDDSSVSSDDMSDSSDDSPVPGPNIGLLPMEDPTGVADAQAHEAPNYEDNMVEANEASMEDNNDELEDDDDDMSPSDNYP